MIKLIEKPLDGLAWLWGLVFPMFSERGAAADQASPGPRWVFRSLVLAVFLLLLWVINQLPVIGLQDWVSYGAVGKFWLPLFGFCLYALLWLGWWLYRAFEHGRGARVLGVSRYRPGLGAGHRGAGSRRDPAGRDPTLPGAGLDVQLRGDPLPDRGHQREGQPGAEGRQGGDQAAPRHSRSPGDLADLPRRNRCWASTTRWSRASTMERGRS